MAKGSNLEEPLDQSYLEGVSTDHLNGGPWVMWPDTPYGHLMIPVVPR